MAENQVIDPLGAGEGMLVLAQMTDAERAERDALAVRGLIRRGAADLVDVLGLGARTVRPAVVSPSSVPCPQCTSRIGQPCIAAKSGQPWNGYHRGRQRRAQELREAAA